MATIGRIKIEDVDTKEARAFKTVGMIGHVEAQEVRNGYTQITVPLTYRLNAADKSDRTFVARFNIKEEWLTEEYARKVKAGTVSGSEAIQYTINVRGLLKGLFNGAGITEGDFDYTRLTNKMVGFRTKPRKDDPSRLDIGAFFTPSI
jgi:hypothetical protein